MRILLLGEYSNVHATLALAFRHLGHKVTVASNGDFWKNYERDIDLSRTPNKLGGIRLAIKLITRLRAFTGYDIVQLINPMFVELRAERIFPIYKFLRKHNRRVVMGAFGMDYYWVRTCLVEKPLRYSDFNIGNELRTNKDALKERADWLGTKKEELNRMMAKDCDAIICGLYEYWVSYKDHYPHKTHFIPFPIVCDQEEDASTPPAVHPPSSYKTRFFLGINKERSEYKGTDIMLQAALDVKRDLPNLVDLKVVESVPFQEYRQLMRGADAILDQLYSYTPSMNSLEAMSHGVICIGGGEPENYDILGDEDLKPIVNVLPSYHSVYNQMARLAKDCALVAKLKKESKEYVYRYHEYKKVGLRYLSIYSFLLEGK